MFLNRLKMSLTAGKPLAYVIDKVSFSVGEMDIVSLLTIHVEVTKIAANIICNKTQRVRA